MKLEIVSENENALLKRKEVVVKVNQETSTASREDLKKQLSKDLKVPEERIAIYRITQPFGKKESTAEVRVYTTKEDLERVEQKYTTERGKQKAAQAPQAEAPAQEGAEKPPEAEAKPAEAAEKPAGEAPKEAQGEGQ